MKKIILVMLVVSLIFMYGCIEQTTEKKEIVSGQTTEEENVVETEVEMEETIITAVDVAQHAVEEDCWLIIEGKVYDVTEFIAQHPGGQVIVEGCGQDATDLFETRPMGSGTPHSDKARGIRDDYYIGELNE